MAVYDCKACGTAISNACAKCDEPLKHDVLTGTEGRPVGVSKCTQGHGMIKSPQCCGQDMQVR